MSSDVSTLSGGSLLLAWQLKDKNVLIVGGGEVASGRIESILVADGKITLISPRDGLHPLTQQFIDATDRITYHDRTFAGPEDLEGVDMVLAAIDDVDASQRICDLCRAARIPVNVADIPAQCDFYFGSQIRRLPLQVMISTNGQGPKMANIVRRKIEENLPEAVEDAITRVGELRVKLRERAPGVGGDVSKRRMKWMNDVCNAWDIEDLALLDRQTIGKLLDEGWEKNRVPTLADVNPSAQEVIHLPAVQRILNIGSSLPEPYGLIVGALIGSTVGLLIGVVFMISTVYLMYFLRPTLLPILNSVMGRASPFYS